MKNDPAFPTQYERTCKGVDGDFTSVISYQGLTKREIFAMAAMQGMLARQTWATEIEIANVACACADALIAQLQRDSSGEGK